ncbi:MAG TPA: hypothetical protein VGQ26_21240 [Streptosporangiaceae bacterium]|nr:hypothetical protein [Streptosporangiaceae bacterium]
MGAYPLLWRGGNWGDGAERRSRPGTSGVARCLQAVLPHLWLAVGVGMLIQAAPASCPHRMQGIEFAAHGAFFGAAMLCYATTVYLLLRSPEAGKTFRSARSRSQSKGALTGA